MFKQPSKTPSIYKNGFPYLSMKSFKTMQNIPISSTGKGTQSFPLPILVHFYTL